MSNPNFGSILDRPAADAVRPSPWPVGSYVAVIQGLPRKGQSDVKKTHFIEYTLKPLAPVEGTVDTDALEEFGGLGEKTMKLTFYLTDNSEYRHTEFLTDDLGLELEKGEGHWDAAQRTAGCQCVIQIIHKPSRDGESVYSEISGTAPVE